MLKQQGLKIFAAVPHFFDASGSYQNGFGSHDTGNFMRRKSIIESTSVALSKALDSLNMEYTVTYYGLEDQFVKQVTVISEVSEPKHLPWFVIDKAYEQIEKYDYFLFVEDDILIPDGLLCSLIDIDLSLDSNEIIIPNRIEAHDKDEFCVDLIAMPGWETKEKIHAGLKLRQPRNVHSGFLLLTREKFSDAYKSRLYLEPTVIIGDYMASALANLSLTFQVYRAIPTSSALAVYHLDSWSERQVSKGLFTLPELLIKINEVRNMEEEI